MEEQKMLLDDLKNKLNNHEYDDYSMPSFSPLPVEENGDVEYYDPDGWS